MGTIGHVADLGEPLWVGLDDLYLLVGHMLGGVGDFVTMSSGPGAGFGLCDTVILSGGRQIQHVAGPKGYLRVRHLGPGQHDHQGDGPDLRFQGLIL